MYNRLVVVRKGREEVKKGAWHLGSAIHNVLNMRHKGRWHVFCNEHAQISTWVRATIAAANLGTDNRGFNCQGVGIPKVWLLVGCLCREVAESGGACTAHFPWHPTNTRAWRAQQLPPKQTNGSRENHCCSSEKMTAATNGPWVTSWDHTRPHAA